VDALATGGGGTSRGGRVRTALGVAAVLTTVKTTGKSGGSTTTGALGAGATARRVSEAPRAAARVRPSPITLAPPRTMRLRTAIPPKPIVVLLAPTESDGRVGPVDNITGRVVVGAQREGVPAGTDARARIPSRSRAGTAWGGPCAIGSNWGGRSESIAID
jgi:hypothetical protein